MSLDNKELLVVQIKSKWNNKYVGLGFDGYFYASEETAQTGKIFSIILLPDDQVLIRLHGSRFLTIDEGGYLRIDLVNEVPTIFRMVRNENGIYSIMSSDEKYLSVRLEDEVLIAKENEIDESTKFKLRLISYY